MEELKIGNITFIMDGDKKGVTIREHEELQYEGYVASIKDRSMTVPMSALYQFMQEALTS